ncbi:MAG: ankyrin repeat protein [Gammaproteobacteria bacterium]|jgi:ankyrin repeat protein
MSKDEKEIINERYVVDEDHDSIIERYPRSKLPLFPVVILIVIFISYYYVSTNPDSAQVSNDLDPLIELSNSVDKETQPHSTNLHELISNGTYEEIAEQLYQVDKININRVIGGMTPIMLAASRGSVEIIDLLLTQGADPNKRGSAERTALQYAVEKNHVETAERLLAYGAEIDAFDNGRLTPLIMAADRGFTELALTLLEKGADPNSQHSQGWTALIDAARNGDKKLVNALLEAGAKKDISMKNGMKARDMAKQNGHSDIVNILAE